MLPEHWQTFSIRALMYECVVFFLIAFVWKFSTEYEHISFSVALYMYHFVSGIMHFIFKCHSMTINCMRSVFYGAWHKAIGAYILRSSALAIYYFIGFPIYRLSAETKRSSCTDYLELLHRKRYTISKIAIATISMDEIASSFTGARVFFLLPSQTIHNGNNLWTHCARALLLRLNYYRCVLAKRFKFALHSCKRIKCRKNE